MTDDHHEPATRKGRSLETEIVRQEAKLKKLQDALKEKRRRDQERNVKAILTVLQAEQLDQVPADTWQHVIPSIKALLLPEAVQAEKGRNSDSA